MSDVKIKDFQKPVNFSLNEEEILKFWDEHKIFEKSISSRPENNPFVFYDGPPFATGLPHYGHILASTTKDVIPRYFTMMGYRVERKWGWDCHGLPIENIVEKDLGLKDKHAIEAFGIDKFNEACRTTVLRYADEWKKVIHRMGRWVDMEHDYKTMEPWYMESLWWVFKELWERGLIYNGKKSMHICPHCGTPLSNFEVTQGYKEVKDISVYVKFKLKSMANTYFIAWTTTPWTVPGNVLLALQPKATYVQVTTNDSDEEYIVASERASAVFGDGKYTISKTLTADELNGLAYVPVFPYFSNTTNAFHTVLADFVTLDEGTGIVHIAPAFGEDDYQIGLKEKIPFVQHVKMDGTFTEDVTDFAGLPVKPKENPVSTDVELIKYLQNHQSLYKKETIRHTYPHCWRCDTPLINYATTSWFVKVTDFKDELLSNNQKINWLPTHIKNGRFGKWLENARDWAISRNRFWGTPLPIWQSEDGDTICVGSKAELETLSGQKVNDLHKHFIDSIVIHKNNKTYRRISEVLDCWFESGAMPYASFHYPFENKTKFEQSFPAEFISEGQDQTRGWFYTLHVLATALTIGKKPSIPAKTTTSSFKNVICSGIVLAEDGKKMSKHLHNYPDPMLMGQKYSIDALRFYLMNSPVVRAENLNFSEKGVDEIRKKVLNIIWNVFSFYKLYDNKSEDYGFPESPKSLVDAWIISKTETLLRDYQLAMNSYNINQATRLIMDYTTDLSTWWLRQSRERIKDSSQNDEVLQIFRTILLKWTLVAAPIIPFISELMYQNLPGMKCESVHLELLPNPNDKAINSNLEQEMSFTRELVEKVHAERKNKALNVRQPLATFTASGKNLSLNKELQALICKETNIKTMNFKESEELSVTLDTNLTDDLKQEGEARELVRKIQDARKAAGVKIDDYIDVTLPSWPKAFESYIKKAVKAVSLNKGNAIAINITQPKV